LLRVIGELVAALHQPSGAGRGTWSPTTRRGHTERERHGALRSRALHIRLFAARPSPTFCTAPCRRTRHGRGRTGEEGGFFPQKLRDLIKYRFKILCSFACLRALACAAPSAHPLHVHGPLSLSQRRPPCLFLPFSLFPPPPHPPCFLLSQTFSPLAATFPAATATPCALSEPRRSVQPCSVDPYIPPTPPTTNAVRPQWIKSRGQSRGRRPGPPTMRFRPNSLSLSLSVSLSLS
jgi:hypothetical protein